MCYSHESSKILRGELRWLMPWYFIIFIQFLEISGSESATLPRVLRWACRRHTRNKWWLWPMATCSSEYHHSLQLLRCVVGDKDLWCGENPCHVSGCYAENFHSAWWCTPCSTMVNYRYLVNWTSIVEILLLQRIFAGFSDKWLNLFGNTTNIVRHSHLTHSIRSILSSSFTS